MELGILKLGLWKDFYFWSQIQVTSGKRSFGHLPSFFQPGAFHWLCLCAISEQWVFSSVGGKASRNWTARVRAAVSGSYVNVSVLNLNLINVLNHYCNLHALENHVHWCFSAAPHTSFCLFLILNVVWKDHLQYFYFVEYIIFIKYLPSLTNDWCFLWKCHM